VENEELKEKVSKGLNTARDKALDLLMRSLGLITDEKLENCNATTLSKIAADMSRVIEKTGDKNINVDMSTKVLVYKPRQVSEDEYEIIETHAVNE
jgi:hypothetical protein